MGLSAGDVTGIVMRDSMLRPGVVAEMLRGIGMLADLEGRDVAIVVILVEVSNHRNKPQFSVNDIASHDHFTWAQVCITRSNPLSP